MSEKPQLNTPEVHLPQEGSPTLGGYKSPLHSSSAKNLSGQRFGILNCIGVHPILCDTYPYSFSQIFLADLSL